jgi:trehalose synthase
MARLSPVHIPPLSLERFRDVLDDAGYRDLQELATLGKSALAGRVVWCVNSTAHGGGVAEMLRSLLSYTRGAGVDSRWVVVDGTAEFFAITKRLHNALHDAAGADPPGAGERALYEELTAAAAEELIALVAPQDVVILHDPQTAGLAPALRAAGIGVAWRCHVGADAPTDVVRGAWDFLRPYVTEADVYVFSRRQFVWEGLDDDRAVIIPPSIDVFSAKNQTLGDDAVVGILATAGLLEDGGRHDATFLREDGTPGRVDRQARLWQNAPVGRGEQIVTQVSRWDRLKDPIGVLDGFAAHSAAVPDAHLVLAGPSPAGVADDPEAEEVLVQLVEAREALSPEVRRRVHIASLPMEDPEENAAIVNALQTYASVVVQKSLAEGFGLTVAEAMWKGRPVVAAAVGGIQDQVIDGVTGLLVDPRDLDAYGRAVLALLQDPELAQRLGAAAREHVRDDFLEPRHLRQWFEVIERISATVAAAG